MINPGDATCPAFNVTNGIVNYNRPAVEDGEYPSSTRATLTCNEGYVEEKQRAVRICLSNGNWWTGYRMACICKKMNRS